MIIIAKVRKLESADILENVNDTINNNIAFEEDKKTYKTLIF